MSLLFIQQRLRMCSFTVNFVSHFPGFFVSIKFSLKPDELLNAVKLNKLVAIDGGTNAGKSTLALLVAAKVPAVIVQLTVLIQRGSINFWFSEDSIRKWKNTSYTAEKGRPMEYSDDAILCALLIRTVYHLLLGATEGLLLSLVSLLDISLKIPSYTQICRRAKLLGKTLKKLSSRRPHDIVFDYTGLKVYGEGD